MGNLDNANYTDEAYFCIECSCSISADQNPYCDECHDALESEGFFDDDEEELILITIPPI